jgi:hypothetical protein
MIIAKIETFLRYVEGERDSSADGSGQEHDSE